MLQQQWWHRATRNLRGMSRHHADVATFMARQLLGGAVASNFVLIKPVVQQKTFERGGMRYTTPAVSYLLWWGHCEDPMRGCKAVGDRHLALQNTRAIPAAKSPLLQPCRSMEVRVLFPISCPSAVPELTAQIVPWYPRTATSCVCSSFPVAYP